MSETIYLVDGTSLAYRSFFAIKLTTSRGFPAGAVYGFYKTLKKMISQYKPAYMGICFDVSRKTHRQEKYKEYKIQRPPVPDSLKLQTPLIKKLIKFMGIALIEQEGFEADDIIASLTRQSQKNGRQVVIVTSDKDMYQLLDDKKVMIYNPGKEVLIDEKSFVNEFGFSPKQSIDYLALTGDSSDNIPGAKGIGKVGAAKLIKEFGSVDNILAQIDDVPGKLRQAVVDSKDDIVLSKELVTLVSCEVDMPFGELQIKEPDYAGLYEMFKELEFKSLMNELPNVSQDIQTQVREDISQDELKKISAGGLVFFCQDNTAYLWNKTDSCVHRAALEDIKPVLADAQVKKITHDLKSQMAEGIVIAGQGFDTKIAAYLLDASLPDYSLAALCSHYLNQFQQEIKPEAAPQIIFQLYQLLEKTIVQAGVDKLFYEVEMPLVYVLREMEKNGVKTDTKALEELAKQVQSQLEEFTKNIYKLAGHEFNLNSPKQLSVVLFEELKIPAVKKTKTGFSTNEEVLEKLSKKHPIAAEILEYRYLHKLLTTYITPLIEQVKEQGGWLHAQFNQTATQTGRLSSSSPNLQSIPIKGKFSQALRKAFVPSFKDGLIISGDYSQIELRILAHFSQDENLHKAFIQGRDIHTFTAALMFAMKESDISDKQRDMAKRVNFGIIYGMSGYGLSRELGISPVEAENFIQDYFARYPKVREYIQKIYQFVEKNGFAATILGRRRYLPDFTNPQVQMQDFARRQAVNTPIQGSCADLIKVAMVNISRKFKEKKLKSRMIIQIHDELVFDALAEEKDEVVDIVRREMESSLKLSVPVKVTIETGKNWGQQEEVNANIKDQISK